MRNLGGDRRQASDAAGDNGMGPARPRGGMAMNQNPDRNFPRQSGVVHVAACSLQ